MKKFFYVLIFVEFFLNSCLAMQTQTLNQKPESSTEKNIDTTKISEQIASINIQIKKLQEAQASKDPSKIEKAYPIHSASGSKVKSLFNFVATNIDNMLTQKGALSTLFILGPLFTAYCVFFNPEPVKKIIAYISAWYTKGAVDVGASIGSGAVNGAIGGVKDNWWELLKIGGVTSIGLTLMQIPAAIMATASPILIKLILLKARVPLDKLK